MLGRQANGVRERERSNKESRAPSFSSVEVSARADFGKKERVLLAKARPTVQTSRPWTVLQLFNCKAHRYESFHKISTKPKKSKHFVTRFNVMSDVKVVRGISEESEDSEDIFASNFGASATINKVKIVGSDNHFEQQAAAIEAAKRGDTIS